MMPTAAYVYACMLHACISFPPLGCTLAIEILDAGSGAIAVAAQPRRCRQGHRLMPSTSSTWEDKDHSPSILWSAYEPQNVFLHKLASNQAVKCCTYSPSHWLVTHTGASLDPVVLESIFVWNPVTWLTTWHKGFPSKLQIQLDRIVVWRTSLS